VEQLATSIPIGLGIIVGCVTIFSALSKWASAWTKKAEAEGRRAAAEERTTQEVAELRKTVANCLDRVGKLEGDLNAIAKVEAAIRRFRADTRGVPVVPDGD
jgi:hypothetical protein